MPAYRSSAEGEIRVAVAERLREIVPGCRIIHEINAETFGNRIDVLAVGTDRIAAVEIKSEKDKLDRLPAQISAMRSVAHHSYAALHEKFLEPLGQAARYGVVTPDAARGAIVWVYPRADRKGHVECQSEWLQSDRWSKHKFCLPDGAIWMLWRKELQEICHNIGMRSVSRLTMEEAVDHIRWNRTGGQITRAICAALRARECVEADPPVSANDNGKMEKAA